MRLNYTLGKRHKIAKKLKEFRRRNALTQKDMAELCCVSYVYICMLENPDKYKYNLQEAKIRRVEKILNIGNKKEEDK